MSRHGGTSTPAISVVIPAHNEAAVIGQLLSRLVAGDPDERLEIVVAANGCDDSTAEVARAVSPRIVVVEVDLPSKIAGLNAGDDAASVLPRAYVDADVDIDAPALLSLARILDTGAAVVAAPVMTVETAASSFWVKQYYRTWTRTAYATSGHVGSGVYAVSAAGRRRWGAFPDVVADDRFVQVQFRADERVTDSDHTFGVHSPRTVRDLVRRAVRIEAGNRQLDRMTPPSDDPGASAGLRHLVRRSGVDPRLWTSLLVYVVIKARVRRAARSLVQSGAEIEWNRDESTRASSGGAW